VSRTFLNKPQNISQTSNTFTQVLIWFTSIFLSYFALLNNIPVLKWFYSEVFFCSDDMLEMSMLRCKMIFLCSFFCFVM